MRRVYATAGSLTVWISLTAGKLVNWDAPRSRRRKPGRQRKYSNHAIETAVTLVCLLFIHPRVPNLISLRSVVPSI